MHISVSRRRFLQGTAAASVLPLATPSLASTVDALPGNAELDSAFLEIAKMAGNAGKIRQIGASRSGRKIMMLSVGDADRSALVVGGPHPNEPVGGATVLRLARMLAGDTSLRARYGMTWHFIGSIDPDGLALNEGWLRASRTLANYNRHFFRPAFADQPEYTFPLEAGNYSFDKPTPENLAWRNALDMTRPAYQVSLHSADVGGVFYITSRDIPCLTQKLAAYPEQAGLSLNSFGEPFANLPSFAPGVFDFVNLSDLLTAAGDQASNFWSAGDSSAGYSGSRFGTFNLVCEVPLWDAAQFHDPSPSGYSSADILARHRHRLGNALERVTNIFDGASPANAENIMIRAAVDEFAKKTPSTIAQLTHLLNTGDLSGALSVRDFAIQDATLMLAAIRPQAMFARLARMGKDRSFARQATNWVNSSVREAERGMALKPVSVNRMTEVQIHAILAGADALGSS